MKQRRCGGDVLACLSEVREGSIIGEDLLVYTTGRGACVPTVSAVLDFVIDLAVLPNKLLSGVIDLQLLCYQLLHLTWDGATTTPAVLASGLAIGVASLSEMLLTCPSEVSAMKHSREG